MQFRCPTCNQLMQCPDTIAGTKGHCPKCGQRVMIPTLPKPTPINKTVLGKLEDATPAAPSPPLASFATAVPSSPPAPARPSRKPSRRLWIGAIIGIGLVSCVVCGGIGLMFRMGPLAPSAAIIGKWESGNQNVFAMKGNLEINKDGTGETDIFAVLPMTLDTFGRQDFRWSIESGEKPILVIDTNGSKYLKRRQKEIAQRNKEEKDRLDKSVKDIGDALNKAMKDMAVKGVPQKTQPAKAEDKSEQTKVPELKGVRQHFYFTVANGTLTLTPLSRVVPALVLRRAK